MSLCLQQSAIAPALVMLFVQFQSSERVSLLLIELLITFPAPSVPPAPPPLLPSPADHLQQHTPSYAGSR